MSVSTNCQNVSSKAQGQAPTIFKLTSSSRRHPVVLYWNNNSSSYVERAYQMRHPVLTQSCIRRQGSNSDVSVSSATAEGLVSSACIQRPERRIFVETGQPMCPRTYVKEQEQPGSSDGSGTPYPVRFR